MNRIIYIYLLWFVLSAISYSQTEYRKHLLSIIKESHIDSVYSYQVINDKNDTTISKIRYLGKTTTNCNMFYIAETYPAALVRHGFKMLYLIDSTSKKYFYGGIDEPDKLENGIISFRNIDSTGHEYYFKTDLNGKIPLFLCQSKGDCYSYLIDDDELK